MCKRAGAELASTAQPASKKQKTITITNIDEKLRKLRKLSDKSDDFQLDNLISYLAEKAHSYKHLVPVEIGKVSTCALVDSGNLWRTVISEAMLTRLGLSTADLRPIHGVTTVGTAKKGEQLTSLGELRRPVTIRLGGLGAVYRIRPAVIQGLAMDVNLSGPFLRTHGIDQLHSEDALVIGGGRAKVKIPLILPSEWKLQKGRTVSPMYIAADHDIPANSTQMITVRVSAMQAMTMKAGDGYVIGDAAFSEATDLHPWRQVLTTCPQEGYLKVGVMNTLPIPVTVRKGRRYGTFTKASWTPSNDGSIYTVGVGDYHPPEDGVISSEEKERRTVEILKVLRLKESPYLQDIHHLARAVALILKYYDTFSWNGEVGRTSLLEHSIPTDPKQQPINIRYRPFNPVMEKLLRKQIDKWLKQDIISPCSSPWNFRIVTAPKKDGGTRVCVDYRPLNDVTLKDQHPIGNIEDNLCRLAKSTIFSAVDGAGAYHVVPVRKEDREKTAFSTPWGSFSFNYMPFGLCSAPQTYARLVQRVLEGIPYQQALPYLDDTIVHSGGFEAHLRDLELVLQAHKKAGLKLAAPKCKLFQKEVEYLGHIVSEKGTKPVPAYIEIVKSWPVPRTRTEVKAFLGKIGYYRKFIKDYQKIVNPLTDKLKQDGPTDKEEFQPTVAMAKACEEIKLRLTEAPLLVYPDFQSEEPFILDTDWSGDNRAVGAVLSQKQKGMERVIAYGAKKLSATQQNYTAYKGEMVAAILFMKHWRYYLQHRPFILRTDHAALKWLKTSEPPIGMTGRMLETLANFDFKIQHRAGTLHGNADGLSRAPHLKEKVEDDTDVADGERIAALAAGEEELTADDWLQAQRQDEDIAFMRKCLLRGEKPTRKEKEAGSPTASTYSDYFLNLEIGQKTGLVCYNKTMPDGQTRKLILVPRQLWELVLWQAHLHKKHQGAEEMVLAVQRSMYFPKMYQVAKSLKRQCPSCQRAKPRKPKQKHTLVSHEDGYPMRKLSIDYVGPLPTSTKGHRYILTVRDVFTRWLEAFPTVNCTAETTVDVLQREVFMRYGLPETLHSDRGTGFTAALSKEVARLLGVSWTYTPSYNPNSNSVERAHRDLQGIILKLSEGNNRAWEVLLPQALYAMNTAVCRMTKFAPYQLMFGRDPTANLDLLFGCPDLNTAKASSREAYAVHLKKKIQIAFAWARKNIAKAIVRQRKSYYKDKESFEPGDAVWLFTPALKKGQSKKFATYWTGPWEVLAKHNDVVYTIKPDPSWGRKRNEVVAVDRLMRFQHYEGQAATVGVAPHPQADLEMMGDEHAEAVKVPGDEDDDDPGPAWPVPAQADHPPPPQPPQQPLPALPPRQDEAAQPPPLPPAAPADRRRAVEAANEATRKAATALARALPPVQIRQTPAPPPSPSVVRSARAAGRTGRAAPRTSPSKPLPAKVRELLKDASHYGSKSTGATRSGAMFDSTDARGRPQPLVRSESDRSETGRSEASGSNAGTGRNEAGNDDSFVSTKSTLSEDEEERETEEDQ